MIGRVETGYRLPPPTVSFVGVVVASYGMYLFLPDMDLWKYQLTGEYLFTFSALLAYAISSLMEL